MIRKLITLWLVKVLVFLPTLAHGANFDTTWADTEWNTTWVETDDIGTNNCDTTDTFAYATTNGNPTFCRNRTCTGRNDASNFISVWAGTWEDLGITPGFTVETIQMLDLDTKYLTDTTCDSVTFGPLELRTSADVLVATLWAGRNATTAEGSFVAEGADPAQSVGSLTASNSNIEIWLNATGDTGNSSSASCVGIMDNLDIRVVASAAAAGATERRRVILAE